jgi:hypothetical protein
MAITRVVKVPYYLPYAHLYLDDVEQIRDVLLEALPPPRFAQESDAAIVTTFSMNDLEMDSIEDLERHGRSTTNFKIKVGRAGNYGGMSVELTSYSEPRIELYSLDQEAKWATYSKIKSIFDSRELALKNAVARLPEWLKFSLYLLFLPILPLVLMFVRVRWFVNIAYWILFLSFLLAIIRPSRVSFVRSHERSKRAVEKREGYIKAIVLLLIGAFIGQVVEVASRWIKAH